MKERLSVKTPEEEVVNEAALKPELAQMFFELAKKMGGHNKYRFKETSLGLEVEPLISENELTMQQSGEILAATHQLQGLSKEEEAKIFACHAILRGAV